jgi:hypothetical protein
MRFNVPLSRRSFRQVVQHKGWLRISIRVAAPGEDEWQGFRETKEDAEWRARVRPLLRFLDKGHLDSGLLESACVRLGDPMIGNDFVQGGRRRNQREAFPAELA